MIQIFKENENSIQVNLNITEANLENADEFKAELISIFNSAHKNIILNLQQVEYIDSSFLGALVASLKHLISFKCDLILVGLRKDVADLFALIRLDKVFKIYPGFADVPSF
jgi:anti-sigma B factor antagonist